MREKLLYFLMLVEALRITPACAGKTSCPAENFEIRPGSPPRVREKPEESDLFADNTGITPACAGKTSTVPMSKEGLRDHPRVCGKNICKHTLALYIIGSPPRVREKLLRISLTDSAWGITPACAGKTLTIATGIPFSQDHPRVCGKN